MKKKIVCIIILLIILLFPLIILMNKEDFRKELINDNKNDFTLNLIKEVNNRESNNYLISPYSIEIALNMVKSGAKGKTHSEIESVVPKRNITIFNIDKRITSANALFIKDTYKKNIKEDFTSNLKKEYNADIIIDKFNTPNKINEWVNDKTNEMIPELLNYISPDFVLGLANAVAIDVEWENKFECISTTEEKFTNSTKEMEVEMLHNTYKDSAKYIETDEYKGVILPYKTYDKNGEESNRGTKLEFIAIMPNNDIEDFISNIENIDSITDNFKSVSDSIQLNLSLPRFTYDYNLEEFMSILKKMGIKSAFDSDLANFSKMISDNDIYIDTAIHKTHIELNEVGTKAAAVTYFGFDLASMPTNTPKYIDIIFNKPFFYIIRDTNSKELLFFGTVYEPNKWVGSTCEEKLDEN